MSDDRENPTFVLKQVLAGWPANSMDIDEGNAARERLAAYLSNDFDSNDFVLAPARYEVMPNPIVQGKTAMFLLGDLLAVLIQDEQQHWRLDMVTYQCPTCFGTGIDGHNILCPACGGTGWGYSNLTFCRVRK
jgi:hypothetical protein